MESRNWRKIILLDVLEIFVVWPDPGHDDDEDGGDVGGEHEVAGAPLHLKHGGQTGEGAWWQEDVRDHDIMMATLPVE